MGRPNIKHGVKSGMEWSPGSRLYNFFHVQLSCGRTGVTGGINRAQRPAVLAACVFKSCLFLGVFWSRLSSISLFLSSFFLGFFFSSF